MFTHLHSCRGMWHRLAKFHIAGSEPVVQSPSPHPSLLKHKGNLNFGLFWEFMLWTLLLTPLITPFVPGKAKWLFLKIFILCVYKINTSERLPKYFDGLGIQGDSGAISATVFSVVLRKIFSFCFSQLGVLILTSFEVCEWNALGMFGMWILKRLNPFLVLINTFPVLSHMLPLKR